MNKALALSFITVSSLVLTACGGGGSDLQLSGTFASYESTCAGVTQRLLLDPPRADKLSIVSGEGSAQPVEAALSSGCEFTGFIRKDGSFAGERAKECIPEGAGRQTMLITGLGEQTAQVTVTTKDAAVGGCETQESGSFTRQ